MKEVVLDTNFLLIPSYFGVDIIGEIERIADFPYRLCIVDKTADELEKIVSTQKGAAREAAKLGQALLKNNNIYILQAHSSEDVDSAILRLAKPGTHVVATQDAELKKRLRENGVQLIVLRQKRYLQLH